MQYRNAMPVFPSEKEIFRKSTIIDAIMVLPAPGIPGQNKILCSPSTHFMNAVASKNRVPVPSWRLRSVSLCSFAYSIGLSQLRSFLRCSPKLDSGYNPQSIATEANITFVDRGKGFHGLVDRANILPNFVHFHRDVLY
jgi:hypothetical protein